MEQWGALADLEEELILQAKMIINRVRVCAARCHMIMDRQLRNTDVFTQEYSHAIWTDFEIQMDSGA